MIIIFRSFLVGVLRGVFLVPLILMAHTAHGFSLLFESLSSGLMDAARSLRSATNAPFVNEWNKQIAQLEDEKRLRTLREFSKNNE